VTYAASDLAVEMRSRSLATVPASEYSLPSYRVLVEPPSPLSRALAFACLNQEKQKPIETHRSTQQRSELLGYFRLSSTKPVLLLKTETVFIETDLMILTVEDTDCTKN
jgi:hypothetical protein